MNLTRNLGDVADDFVRQDFRQLSSDRHRQNYISRCFTGGHR